MELSACVRQADGSVYANSYLGRAIENKLLNVPEPDCIQNNPNMTMPYVFLADDAFGLKPNFRPARGGGVQGYCNTRYFWHQIPIYPNLGECTYTKYLKYRKDRDTKYQMY